MRDILGTWRLVREERFDAARRPLPTRFGEHGIGLVRFDGQRMMAVLVDNDPAPKAAGEARAFNSYCGAYTFDGERLVTRVDAGLPELIGSDQVRQDRRLDAVPRRHQDRRES